METKVGTEPVYDPGFCHGREVCSGAAGGLFRTVSWKLCGSGFGGEELGESMMSRLAAKCAWSVPKLLSVGTKGLRMQEKAMCFRLTCTSNLATM